MHEIETPSAARMVIGGRSILNFGGSSYLGLSAEPALLAAGQAALSHYGATAQLPRHYGMVLGANAECEREAAHFFDVDRAIYFATGYLFGLIALPGLADRFDVALIDETAHFSLADGARLAGREVVTIAHCDSADLGRKLVSATKGGKRPLVATDGMFATFGEVPPLAEYARLLAPHEGWLVVDESHSFGALGARGRGAVELEQVSGPRTVSGGSLGKAFCAYGGLALGSAEVIDALLKAPAARGAAAGMSAGAAMASAAMRLVSEQPERIAKLRANAAALRTGLERLGFSLRPTPGPILTFSRGTLERNHALQKHLWDEGINVILSNYIGAGPEGAIRCAVFADHAPDDIERLLSALAKTG